VAPNILRCKELKVNPVVARLDIRADTAVIVFLICYTDKIFFDLLPPTGNLPSEGNALC
jgi:hypothetical protein